VASTAAVYFGGLETDSDRRLRAAVIYFVGLNFGQDPHQVRAVGQIAVVELKMGTIYVWVLIDMVNPLRIE
jgi:hypothetical protein